MGDETGSVASASSFLKAEEDEFERLFTELLYASHSRAAGKMADDDRDTSSKSDGNTILKEVGQKSEESKTRVGKMEARSPRVCDDVKLGAMGAPGDYGALRRRPQAPFQKSRSFHDRAASPARQNGSKERLSDGAINLSTDRAGKGLDTENKLFLDLLDDLDNITGDTPSAKRRQKARDIFSDWLFSEQVKADNAGQRKKNRKSFHEFYSHREEEKDDMTQYTDHGDTSLPERRSRSGSLPSDKPDEVGNKNEVESPQLTGSPLLLSDIDALSQKKMCGPFLVAPRPSVSPELSLHPQQKKVSHIETKSENTQHNAKAPLADLRSNTARDHSPAKVTPSADYEDVLKNVNYRKKVPKGQVAVDYSDVGLGGKFGPLGGRRNIYQRWKVRGRPLSLEFLSEDDADSGYHTGESTLRGVGSALQVAPPPPGERTLTREDLKRRIDAFNDNQHGLVMKLRETSDTFQGFIRVYMNLMRPISMSLTARPPSIYDVLTPDPDSPDSNSDTQTTSFYLPKDTTKVIHITSDTTAQEVIRALLQKFRITDNPRKFALYERIDEQDQKYLQHKASRLRKKATMRRLTDEECPLALCLSWTSEGLNKHRFILQENDSGEIMWEAFSIPELDNFLRILDREEDEYVEQLKAKYHLLRIQITQHMKPLEPKQKQYNNDHRQPVFV